MCPVGTSMGLWNICPTLLHPVQLQPVWAPSTAPGSVEVLGHRLDLIISKFFSSLVHSKILCHMGCSSLSQAECPGRQHRAFTFPSPCCPAAVREHRSGLLQQTSWGWNWLRALLFPLTKGSGSLSSPPLGMQGWECPVTRSAPAVSPPAVRSAAARWRWGHGGVPAPGNPAREGNAAPSSPRNGPGSQAAAPQDRLTASPGLHPALSRDFCQKHPQACLPAQGRQARLWEWRGEPVPRCWTAVHSWDALGKTGM